MNIKTKLLFGIGILAGMIILLVTLSVVNLQLLTATDPDSPCCTACPRTGFIMDLCYRRYLCTHRSGSAFFGYRVPLVDLFLSLNKVFLK